MKYLIILLSFFTTICNSQVLDFLEKRDVIVILDSGISLEQSKQPYMCDHGVLSTFDDNGIDEHGHGTNIVSLISPKINIQTTCLTSIKVWIPTKDINGDNYMAGLKIAVDLSPKFLNISMTGTEKMQLESDYLLKILANGGTIDVAAGNEHKDLSANCFSYPACYRNSLPSYLRRRFNVVGSSTTNSNFGGPVNVYLDGSRVGTPILSGSSQATALMTASLISK